MLFRLFGKSLFIQNVWTHSPLVRHLTPNIYFETTENVYGEAYVRLLNPKIRAFFYSQVIYGFFSSSLNPLVTICILKPDGALRAFLYF